MCCIAMRRIAIPLIMAGAFSLLAAQERSPNPRTGAHMVFDPTLGKLVMFGGTSGDEFPNDLWSWDGKVWRAILPANPPKPPGRDEPNLAYDVARSRLVMFRGRRKMPGESSILRGDVWEWDGKNWSEIPTSPHPILHAAAVYDPVAKRVVKSSGIDADGISKKLTQWNGASWQEVDQAGPASLVAASVATNGDLLFVVCQSGRSSDQVPTLTWRWNGRAWSRGEAGPPITSLQASASAPDGAIFIYQTQEWLDRPILHVRSPAGVWNSNALPHQPPGRIGAAAGYDPLRKRFVIFGGYAKGGQLLGDTWEFDGAKWTEK